MNTQTEKLASDTSARTSGSIHLLIQETWTIGGFVYTRPIEAFKTRKKANAKMREKNERATGCNYVVKSVKLSE